jgi:hypothetical protein
MGCGCTKFAEKYVSVGDGVNPERKPAEARTPVDHGHKNVYEEMYLEEERVRGRRAVGIIIMLLMFSP